MKLFWKMFYSMVLMTVLFCSIGGHFLIYRQFENSLKKEVEGIFEENDLLCHMLIQERKAHPLEEIETLAEKLNLSVGQRKLYFRISESDGTEIGGNGNLPVEARRLVSRLGEEQQGWEMIEKESGEIYLHGAAAMMLGEKTVFLETCRDVTDIYLERQEQTRYFYRMMGGFACIIGVLSFVIIRAVLRPVKFLSETTRKIAEGELHRRVPIRSRDEFGQLSRDFNSMADSLETKIEELKEAAIRQEEFMGSFAHEMKTPMTSIIGYADLLRSFEMTPEKVRENADYIFKEGRRLENLSGKMMDLIVLGKEEVALRPISMSSFFDRLKNEFRPMMEKASIDFQIECEEMVLAMDEDLMMTVCLNLLDNARKAVTVKEEGKIELTGIVKMIRTTEQTEAVNRQKEAVRPDVEGPDETGKTDVRKEKKVYCITVTDNGCGIPKEQLSRITEAFYMVDKSRSRAMGGAGLGLSICEKIVRLHEGNLIIDSTPGKGTKISIWLEGGEKAWKN